MVGRSELGSQAVKRAVPKVVVVDPKVDRGRADPRFHGEKMKISFTLIQVACTFELVNF